MDLPLQASNWPWYYVATYFFLGGLAAGSYLLAAIADLFGDSEQDEPLIKMATYLSFVTVAICPLLLILDLGRPERFWRMLTQFKVLSPVSLGSWGLLFFGLFVTLSTVIWLSKDGFFDDGPLKALKPLVEAIARLPRKWIAGIGALFGIFVGGYTGVLLSSTTIPFWNSNQFLGITFLVSALSTSIAAVCLLLIWKGHDKLTEPLRDLWLMVIGFEVFLVAWELLHEGGSVLLTGQFMLTFGIGVVLVGVLIPLILLMMRIGKTMPRNTMQLTAVLVLIGGFLFRYSILMAGQESTASLIQWLDVLV